MKWIKILLTGIMAISLCACNASGKKKSLLQEEPQEIEKKILNKHHYVLDVSLDTEKQTISGEMTVEVKNNSTDEWQELYLRDYASIIDVNSKPTEFKKVDDGTDELKVTVVPEDISIVRVDLITPLKAGESMTLHLVYESYLVLDAYGRFNYTAFEQDGRQMGHYTLGNFYPVLSYYEDGQWISHPYYEVGECFYTPISDYDVTITTPKDYVVSATGVMQEEEYHDDLVTRVYHEEDVRDFAMSAANDYLVLTDEIDGITVKSYYYEGCESAAQFVLEEAKNGLQLFNRYLGKYPYQEFDIAPVPALSGGGMEFPGYVMIIERYYYDFMQDSLSKAVIHELAHQWFYGIVGNDEYDAPWLDESMASLMQLIYLDYFYETRYNEQVAMLTKNLSNDMYTDIIVSKSYGEYEDAGAFVNASYSVGLLFMYEVKEEMGDEQFINAMREYVSTYGYLEAKTENLVEILNKWSNHSLEKMYQTYLEPEYYQ